MLFFIWLESPFVNFKFLLHQKRVFSNQFVSPPMSSDLMNRQLSDKLKPFSTLVLVVSCVSVISRRPVIVCPSCGDNCRIPLRSDLGCVCLHRCASGTFGWIETPSAVAFGQTSRNSPKLYFRESRCRTQFFESRIRQMSSKSLHVFTSLVG